MSPEETDLFLAEQAYNTYCDACNWTSDQGGSLPLFGALSECAQRGWVNAVHLVHQYVQQPDASPDSHVEAVRASLLKRSIVGLEKYKVTTERDDLTTMDWLKHAQEEALDLAVYLQRIIKNADNIRKKI